MKKEIHYIKGDATQPKVAGNKIIVHVCNDIGGWGRGFVLALSSKWPEPESAYRQWHQSGKDFTLGSVQFVQVEEDVWVGNIIGQRDVKKDAAGNPPVRYEAIREALEKVAQWAIDQKASVHMPRIGCGLAGGTWEQMEPIIQAALSQKEIEVYVYDL